MKKGVSFFIFLLGFRYILFSQVSLTCADVANKYAIDFIKLIDKSSVDSINMLINEWQMKCGANEPVFRARVLLCLNTGKKIDSLIKSDFINKVISFQNRMNIMKSGALYYYDEYKSFYGYVPVGEEFDGFTIIKSKDLLNKFDKNSQEYLVCDLYSGNCSDFFLKIQDKNFIGTPIRKQYDSLVYLYSRLSEGHLSLFNGIWIPIGYLRAVGNHVQTGFQIGFKKMRMNYDVTIAIKYLNSKNYYEFIKNDSLYSTNYFLGAYCGFEVGRDIWYSNGHELQILIGIGFDGFTVYEEKSNSYNTQQKKTSFNTNSYNFNFGLSYRYYITNSFYIGLKAKYNLADYTLNKIISYQGDVITFDLVLGTVNNLVRNQTLKKFQYKGLRKNKI